MHTASQTLRSAVCFARSVKLDAFAFLRQIIDQHILAQMVGASVERASAIDLRHLLDESAEAWRVVEHKGVDRDPLARHPFNFLQSLLRGAQADTAEGERPFAIEPLVQEI